MTAIIRYSTSLEQVTADQLRGGFFVGWPNPPAPETHLRLLQGSAYVVLAWDGEQVVGFITAISDGVLSAYIPALEVLPAYQGQGIGTALVQQMLEQLRHLYMIDLICDAYVQAFYARVGMRPYTGMIHRNHDRQSGA
jgi:ribosomal protein S18 acetylase RimI-like enzyme